MFIHYCHNELDCDEGNRGHDRMVVEFTTTYMQSVPITTKLVSSNPIHGEVYSIQHYVIKFVIDLCQVGRFFHVLWFYSTNKTDRHNINEILMKVALSTINQP